jgi:hypothetical protein
MCIFNNIIEISTEIEYKYFEKGDEYILTNYLIKQSQFYDMSNLIDILEKEILI